MSGSRDDETVRVLDSRDYALFVTVTPDGVCEAKASIPKAAAAYYLRAVADSWDPPTEDGVE